MKIHLRKTTEADLDFVIAAEQSAENRPFVVAWSRKQHREAFDDQNLSHLVIENMGGERVGYIILAGLTDANDCIEFRRIVVTEKNRGYGKQALQAVKNLAFDELKAHRLWLDVKEQNARARHVYEAEGFRAEGVLRECLKTETGYESLVVMSMLRGEYEAKMQNGAIRIRVAAPEDAESIAEVLAESFAEYESLYTPPAYTATVPTVDEIRGRFGKEMIWVALRGEIIGTVSAVPKKDALYIRSMAILPKARGQRIGEKLLNEIEKHAGTMNYRKLFLNTTPFLKRAIRLYEKFGFVFCGADDLYGTPLLTMEKSLESKSGKAAEK